MAIDGQQERELILKSFPIADIWGVGRRLAPKLNRLGIQSAYDLAQYPPKLLRKQFSVNMEKLVYELQGISCLPLEAWMPRQNIQSSRSFGRPVMALQELIEAVSTYAATACEKVRQQKSVAQGLMVFLHTSHFKEGRDYYSNQSTLGLSQPTDDTRVVIHAAIEMMKALYRSGYQYQKCGVMLLDLIPNTHIQYDLLPSTLPTSNPALMKTLDTINKKLGKQTIRIVAEGLHTEWQMKAGCRSPRYTTHWNELAKVKCD